jgi:hypothetical protein
MKKIEDGRRRKRLERAAIIVRLLSRPEGASLAELMGAAKCSNRTAKSILMTIDYRVVINVVTKRLKILADD